MNPCMSQWIVAHRGASAEAPENTLSAFRLAWEQKADAIEADFYLTSDQQIVCIHDKTTKRTAPSSPELHVAQSTLEQLRQLDVGSWKDPRYQGERIPTLNEVLEIVPEGKKIFVEIKCGPEILVQLEKVIRSCKLHPEQIVFISFNEDVIRGVRSRLPGYRANWLAGYKQNKEKTEWTPKTDEVLKRLQQTNASGLGTQGNREIVDKKFVEEVQSLGIEFHVWTINEPQDAAHFAALGALSITTDKPKIIRNSLETYKASQSPLGK